MANCTDKNYVAGCFTLNDGTKQNVLIHISDDQDGAISEILDLNLQRVIGANPSNTTIGACQVDFPEDVNAVGDFCYQVPGSTEVINGSDAAPWVIIADDIELTRAGGNNAGDGGFQNGFLGDILYSLDGVNFDTFQNTFGGGGTSPIINADPLYLQNSVTGTIIQVDITSFSGGGASAYTGVYTNTIEPVPFSCRLFEDGTRVCADADGNIVDFDSAWESVPCKVNSNICNESINVINQNDVRSKECFSKPSALVDNLATLETGSENANTAFTIFPNDAGVVNSIFVRLNNIGVTEVPYQVTVSGTEFISQVITAEPTVLGFTPGVLTPGTWIYELKLTSPITLTDEITLQGEVNPDIFWTSNGNSDNNQIGPVNTGVFPAVRLVTEGIDKYFRTTTLGGVVTLTNETGAIIDSLPDGAEPEPCEVVDGAGCDEVCNQDLANRIAEADKKFIGKICYRELELLPIGDLIPIDSGAGTLTDGTTFTLNVVGGGGGGGSIIYSSTTPGDTRWTNNSILNSTFSNPVEITLSPTNGGDVLNPIVLQDQASGTSNVQSDGTIQYTPGIFDAQLSLVTPNNLRATLSNATAPDASDPWGQIVINQATGFDFLGRDAEAVNVSVRLLESTLTGPVREAYGCIEDGLIVYRDSITNDVVQITEQNAVSCNESSPSPHSTDCYKVGGSGVDGLAGVNDTPPSSARVTDISFIPSESGMVSALEVEVNNDTGAPYNFLLNFGAVSLAPMLLPTGLQTIRYDFSTPIQVTSGVPVIINPILNNLNLLISATTLDTGELVWTNAASQGFPRVKVEYVSEDYRVLNYDDGSRRAFDSNNSEVDISGGIPADWSDSCCEDCGGSSLVDIDTDCKEELARLIGQEFSTALQENDTTRECYQENVYTSVSDAFGASGGDTALSTVISQNNGGRWTVPAGLPAGQIAAFDINFYVTGAFSGTSDVTWTLTNTTTNESVTQLQIVEAPDGIEGGGAVDSNAVVLDMPLAYSAGDVIEIVPDSPSPANITWRRSQPLNSPAIGDWSWINAGQINSPSFQLFRNDPNSFTVITTNSGTSTAVDGNGDPVDITAGIPASWSPVDCDGGEEESSITNTLSRTNASNTYSSYRSLSVTALSGDVTIDGQPIPEGFTWSVSSSKGERYDNSTTVIGTDYLTTEVQ